MRAHVASLALACALVALLLGSGGCEAIVSGDVPGFTCTGTTLRACPPLQYCKGAGCTSCEKIDICDGYDNDCNGHVDDGPLSDHDADGFTNCGRQDPKTGQFVNKDCDDNDVDVHPGADEVCNGKDDDCDGVVDNPDVVCSANQICVPGMRMCLDKASSCTVTPCLPPKRCDTDTQRCVDPPSVDDGGACSVSSQCTSQICGDASILGNAFKQKSGSVCTKTCCTSSDCRPGFICYAAGTGGDYCVPAASAPGPARAATPGAGAGGASCTSGGAQCRSGLCGANGKCLDSCCSDAQCTNGTSCALNTASGLTVFQCVDSPGTRGQNSSCSRDSDCKSGICFNYGDNVFPERHCVNACCGSANCGSVDFGFGNVYPAACYDANNKDATVFGNETDAICLGVQSVGATPLGGTCSQNSDCRSYRCLTTEKKCTDVCCTDGDCASGSTGWVCRPTSVGSGTFLRCQPGPMSPH